LRFDAPRGARITPDAERPLPRFPEDVMADHSSKSDQIRKLREARLLASERVDAERKADAKSDSKLSAIKKKPKTDT